MFLSSHRSPLVAVNSRLTQEENLGYLMKMPPSYLTSMAHLANKTMNLVLHVYLPTLP